MLLWTREKRTGVVECCHFERWRVEKERRSGSVCTIIESRNLRGFEIARRRFSACASFSLRH